MANGLVIVESPAKAKTIKGFLGDTYEVMSCYGHVRDLPKHDLGVDVENGFTPKYVISPEKRKVISQLKAGVKNADTVWLATDEDREGEAISWHLVEALKLDRTKTKRIVFHEITQRAIQYAVEHPRELNDNQVLAQQARRVLDRLVGYELSPVLWKKVKGSLSAGRVQSVAVRLIVEKEREYQLFKPKSHFKITADFSMEGKAGTSIIAEYKTKISEEEKALSLLNSLRDSRFRIKNIEIKPGKRTPSPPFTTSTLQQEAGRKLGFSVKQTMRVAQRLYEEGRITYMRTDSVHLADTALKEARSEIIAHFGEQYANPRQYETKIKGAQEAHEAIRPTSLARHHLTDKGQAAKLYGLIWRRTMASQMSDAEIERTLVTIEADKAEEDFIAKGEVLLFDGFLKVYLDAAAEKKDKEVQTILPSMRGDETLHLNLALALQNFTKPPARFSEPALVRRMEELGIGRPSTYAPTISLIQERGYVEKRNLEGKQREVIVLQLEKKEITRKIIKEKYGADKGKLIPTDIGLIVNDFLVEHFNKILDYGFTAKVENAFDLIAQGTLKWNEMLAEFYADFHKKIEEVTAHSPKATGERLLGKDPDTGKNVYVRIGRYGPMAQIGESTDEEKPRFASLSKNQSISSIGLEEALALFKLPLEIGEFEGKPVVVSVGKYGPYIRHGDTFYSLDGNQDPFSVTFEKATDVILSRRPRILGRYQDEEVSTGMGRYGPYVMHKKKYYSIPKSLSMQAITLDEAIELIKQKTAKKKKPKRG